MINEIPYAVRHPISLKRILKEEIAQHPEEEGIHIVDDLFYAAAFKLDLIIRNGDGWEYFDWNDRTFYNGSGSDSDSL